MIRVVIADESPIFLRGLKDILHSDPDIRVVGEARNGAEVVKLCEKLAPDLVLTELQMSSCGGVEGIKHIKEKYSNIKVIVLTTLYHEEYITETLKYGIDGYILKGISGEDLLMTIKSTMKGLSVFEHRILKKVKDKYRNLSNSKINVKLSGREMEILKLIVDGQTNKEIAKACYLAEGTVRNVTSLLINRFALKDRTQLAVFAIKNNIV